MSKYFALWVCLFLLIGLSILYSIAEVILLGASKLCMCVLAQSCLTLCNPTNSGWPARLLFHKIFQVRILEWVAISSSRGSSWSRDQTCISCVSYIVGRFFTTCPMWEACWQILNCYAVVQSLSHVYLFANPWNTVRQASLSSLFQSLLRLMFIELMIPPNHLPLCCPLMLLLSIFPSIWVFFQWIGCSHQVAKALELQLQHSLNIPMNIQGWFPLGLTGLISLLSKRLSRVFSNTTVQKHQFFSAQPSLWSNSHIHTWLLEKS